MSLDDRLARLDPRERRLMSVAVGVAAALLLLAVPLGARTWLGEAQGENQRLREALESIQQSRASLERRDEARQATAKRYAKPAPALAGYLAGLAEEQHLVIPESQDRPVVPHGKRYEERSTRVVLRKVGMYSLVKFLEAIAQAPHPLAVTRLDLRKRGAEPDSWDVELVVSAFDRKTEPTKAKAGAEAAADGGAAPGSAP